MKRIGIKAIRMDNMRRLIKQSGNQRLFAERADINPAYVSQMMTGRRDMGEEVARKIDRAFGKAAGWMDQNHGSNGDERDQPSNVQSGPEHHRSLPLISWVQAGSFSEVMDNFQPGQAEEWLPCPFSSGENAFALTVNGPSMEPEYKDGDIIYVDPDRQPINGSHVVVRLAQSNEATFKKLVMDGGKVYLQALNPDWPERIIQINGDAEIVGVVFFSGRRR